MARTVKRRIFAGPVCEQYVYNVSDRVGDPNRYEKKPRFETEADRKEFNRKVAWQRHARSFNANFGPTSLYSTLTCDDEHEIFDFKDAKKIMDNYLDRLIRKYPKARIRMYTGRGKTTHRIHFHMVSEGVPKEVILEKWHEGRIYRISNLREHNKYNGVDHGRDYTGLANYLIAHWTEEVGGHRYKQRGKFREPEKEKVTECKRSYSEEHPPVAPRGYTLVETRKTKYGFLWFKYVALPQKRKYTRRKTEGEDPS